MGVVMSAKISLKHVEAFLAVAEHGNFSTAARHLNIAQPVLSNAVKYLESELGLRLFDRTTRRVELTSAGIEFRASSSKVLEDLEHAVQNARDLAARRRGRIRIAAPPLLSSAILPHVIAAFHEEYPNIAIELTDTGTEQIVQNVIAGSADCGLGTFPPDEEGVERSVLLRDNLALFFPKGHPIGRSKSVRWAELRGMELIALTSSSGIRLLMDIGAESADVSAKPAFEVSLVTTALALVKAGLGVSVLPAYALSIADHYGVEARPLSDPTISRDLVFIHASGRSASPAVSSFYAVLRSTAQKLSPQL